MHAFIRLQELLEELHFHVFVHKKKMFELMQVQIPAVWIEHISISKWSEPSHNGRSRIFCHCFFFLAESERLEKECVSW